MTLRPLLAIGVLVLVSLACGQYVPTVTPTTPAATATRPSPAPTVTRTPEIAPEPSQGHTAVILRPLVNVRETPGGAVIVTLAEGDTVTVNICSDSWCEIVEPVEGWIFAGCLDMEASEKLGCRAE